MKSLRESEQGCYFSIAAGLGDRRVIGLRGKHMPFNLPPITLDPVTGKGNGRNIGLTLRDESIPVPIDIDCWVPSEMTISDLAEAVGGADWNKVYARLRKARIMSAGELSGPLSREMREYQHESLQNPVPPLRLGTKHGKNRNGAASERPPVEGFEPAGDPIIWTNPVH